MADTIACDICGQRCGAPGAGIVGGRDSDGKTLMSSKAVIDDVGNRGVICWSCYTADKANYDRWATQKPSPKAKKPPQPRRLRSTTARNWAVALAILAAFIGYQVHVDRARSKADLAQLVAKDDAAKADLAAFNQEAACTARAMGQGDQPATAVNGCLTFRHQDRAVYLSDCIQQKQDTAYPTAQNIASYWTNCYADDYQPDDNSGP